MDVLWSVQKHQMYEVWHNYINETLDHPRVTNKERRKRLYDLLKKIEIGKRYTKREIVTTSADIAVMYALKSERSLSRDLNFLVKIGLLQKEEDHFLANLQPLVECLPKRRLVDE